MDMRENFIWLLAGLNMILCVTFLVCICVIWNFFRHRKQYKVRGGALIMNALIAILAWVATIITGWSETNFKTTQLMEYSARAAEIFLISVFIKYVS